MSVKQKLGKVWNVFTTVVVVIVVLVAVFLMGSRIVGFRVFNVISGSMEPQYSVGDLIYVKEVNPESIKVGDPITFVLNENLVVATHRVVKIDAENKHFYTKGDANDTPDKAPVHFNNVIGKPVFSIPLLGYVSDYVRNPPGTYVVITLGVLLVIALFLPDMIRKRKTEKQNDEIEKDREELIKVKAELEEARAKLEAVNSGSDTQN